LLLETHKQQLSASYYQFYLFLSNKPSSSHRTILFRQKYRVKRKQTAHVLLRIWVFCNLVRCLHLFLHCGLVLRLSLLRGSNLCFFPPDLYQADCPANFRLYRHKFTMEFYNCVCGSRHLSYPHCKLESSQSRSARVCSQFPPRKRALPAREDSKCPTHACFGCQQKIDLSHLDPRC
jgi:hypothetical protein